ncbi:MAG: helix-turn-helix transcriptional regulator [Gammaproteobacteria bacterium]|nr:helix-turn-helix transcriptional regulator [Gammaproteobacteria bacterium]
MTAISSRQLMSAGVLEQSPGFFGVLSLDSKLLMINKLGLEWVGFSDPDAVVGISYENLRCKAAEDAEMFVWQDELVKNSQHPLYFIGCYCYADNAWKTIFGKKYLIQDEIGQDFGIVSQFDDVTNYRMIDISRFIVNASKKYINKKSGQQFCFLLTDCIQDIKFSTRELECLFFVLRGKTNKGISKLLDLSPRTVESYIEQIKFKMGCANREEVIEKSIYQGYMNILPPSLLQKDLIG